MERLVNESMIQKLAEKINRASREIDRWYEKKLSELPSAEPPIYGSVDIRNAGFKIAVVDTNLFPAGFNNLCETFSGEASRAFQKHLKKWHPAVRKILIFPEEHTRNLFYWKNIVSLKQILEEAGYAVEVGSASSLFSQDPTTIEIEGKKEIQVHKVFVQDSKLRTSSFEPDLILINNDLSTGIPDYLKDLNQTLLPSPHLGWHRRRKGDHFRIGRELLAQVAEIIQIDPWILTPLTSDEISCDLNDEICLKHFSDAADVFLAQIREKYRQHGIQRAPYLFVKSSVGTYGLGVIHIESGDQLLKLNRRMRKKLESGKGNRRVNEYILQEGIPTADLFRGKPLEPVVYLVGGESVGTFFRIHEKKNEMESLNTPGMDFSCLCLHKVEPPKRNYQLTYENKDELFQVAGLLGKIALLASLYEISIVNKEIS